MVKKQEHEISLSSFRIQDSFWSYFQDLVKDTVIPYQEQILKDELPDVEKSHAIENFRIAAGESDGEYYGMVFQDSDVAKWLEAVAYSLALSPDPELEKRADDIIALIGRAQQEDGYLNTYFTVKEPEHRWQNLHDCHELYCAGHMIEAAVAYYEATGKRDLLDIMCRMADHIDHRFGKGKTRESPAMKRSSLRSCAFTALPARTVICTLRSISSTNGEQNRTISRKKKRTAAGITGPRTAPTETMPRTMPLSENRTMRLATV